MLILMMRMIKKKKMMTMMGSVVVGAAAAAVGWIDLSTIKLLNKATRQTQFLFFRLLVHFRLFLLIPTPPPPPGFHHLQNTIVFQCIQQLNNSFLKIHHCGQDVKNHNGFSKPSKCKDEFQKTLKKKKNYLNYKVIRIVNITFPLLFFLILLLYAFFAFVNFLFEKKKKCTKFSTISSRIFTFYTVPNDSFLCKYFSVEPLKSTNFLTLFSS